MVLLSEFVQYSSSWLCIACILRRFTAFLQKNKSLQLPMLAVSPLPCAERYKHWHSSVVTRHPSSSASNNRYCSQNQRAFTGLTVKTSVATMTRAAAAKTSTGSYGVVHPPVTYCLLVWWRPWCIVHILVENLLVVRGCELHHHEIATIRSQVPTPVGNVGTSTHPWPSRTRTSKDSGPLLQTIKRNGGSHIQFGRISMVHVIALRGGTQREWQVERMKKIKFSKRSQKVQSLP
jgi:hypothetical protein